MPNEVLNAIERNLRAFRHVSQETEPVEKELGTTWYKPSEDVTYKWVNNNGVLQWEVITGRRVALDIIDPVATNDEASGYDVGSVWINTATLKKFTLLDCTAGSAVWVRSVDVDGDTMSGGLTLNADPTLAMEAATKQYVDTTAGAGLTQEDVEDIAGDMFNVVHNGISVSYDDANGTLTLDVNDPRITISGAATGSAIMTDLSNTNIAVSISSINNVSDVSTTGAVVDDILVFDGVMWENKDSLDGGDF
jgi:hypothetical protein